MAGSPHPVDKQCAKSQRLRVQGFRQVEDNIDGG
jgi:hypothetical protein